MNASVGNTKLISLEIFDVGTNHIYIKDESTNPSGSIKDRTVYQMLLDYKDIGLLKEGSTIIEATSGNTGISLGYFQKEFGYNAIIVMPLSASIERRQMILNTGATLDLVDGGMKECNLRAEELLSSIKNSFIFDQFNNKSNPKAHLATANEIDRQLEKVDYIFAGIGTGGTVTGIASYFKNSNTRIIGIEPEESPLITKGIASHHLIQGIGANFIPAIFDKSLLFDVITVKGKDAVATAKEINQKGFNNGISSGAALFGALKYIKQNKLENSNIVVIFPDKGDRYSW